MNEMLRTLRHATTGLFGAAFCFAIGGLWPLLFQRSVNPVLLLIAGLLAAIAAIALWRSRRRA